MKNYFVRSGLLCLTYMVVFASLPKLLMSQPLVSKAGFYELPGAGREVFNFNVGWKFRKGEQSGAFELNFNDSFWEAVNLPHSLELLPTEASGGVNYQGSAWYRKHFEVPASWAGKKLFLHFEAIMGKSRIWVDGIEVMSHYGGYLPVVVDISQLSQKPGEHLIAVWCDNSDDGFYPPGKPQGTLDFSYFGGIYRDAWLVTTSPVYVTDPNFANNVAGGGVLIHFDEFSESKVVVGVNTDVKNELTRHGEFWVCQRLVDDKGEEVASVKNKVTIPAGSSLKSIQKLVVKSPRMWTPDSPVLYRLETTVRDRKGKVFDGIASRIGIRKIEFRGRDGFYLNGQPYQDKLIGGNRHQDYAYVGNALPNSGQWRDAKKLRDAGMRIIRSAHYPQDPAFMDACDELGLFVIVATPGWQFWNEVPDFEQRVYNDIRNMVRRDRNHPSVIMWEPILNETWYPAHFAKATHELVKEEYPYQGAYTACDSEARGHEWFDVQYTHPFGNVLFDNH
jgi:beta-galactosidase